MLIPVQLSIAFNGVFEEGDVDSSAALNRFQWGGTIFALILLILNRTGHRSGMQSNLLVLFLFTSFPTVLFKILRGQFGYWISFLAVSANLFFPQYFPEFKRQSLLRHFSPEFRQVARKGSHTVLIRSSYQVLKFHSFHFRVVLFTRATQPQNIFHAYPTFIHSFNSSKMSPLSPISSIIIVANFCCISLILAQQPYEGQAFTDCRNPDVSKSVFGYTCNGLNRSCQTYLTFRSQPPYNTVSSIANMLASDPSQLAEINSVSESATFATNKLVLVPVTCSCSGQYYQLNTSHVVVPRDTYLVIANNTFQGLSTCQAMIKQNSNLTTKNLYTGTRVTVPLRCACPTKNQTDLEINYLMSYLIAPGDFVSKISDRFDTDTGRTLEANGLSEQAAIIYPFTTLLVPLENPPSSSQTTQPPSSSPPSTPAISPASPKNSMRTWIYVVAGAIGGGGFVMVIALLIFFTFFRRISKKETDTVVVSESFEALEKPLQKERDEGSGSQDFLEPISSDIAHMALSLKVYTFEELQSATENFSSSCLIKGSVFRGIFDGDVAAVKKMNGNVSKEINLLNKINHFNLIRLSGVCFNDGHWYLIYEYAVNGPLSNWIYFKDSDGKLLSWTQRLQILLDVASGLDYLHSFTTPPHVHKDIKSSNILLDSDFRAKIANFGLARSADARDGHFSLTNHIVGTIGYMAPEYLENGLISTKLDVYAFGALMLELLTGKEVAVLYEQNVHLSDTLHSLLNNEDGGQSLRQFMDPALQENYPQELAVFVIRLIDSCLKKNPGSRPAMNEMVQFLSRTMSNSLTWELSSNTSGNQGSQGVLDGTETG
ncbi:lysM domain receptor-like kinase 4 [Argentina anserina]|uniref:lysM domain receptor-like kinase 4 n=1 Tax=Argentina anserina TaxID=57926 RepID=UPI002176939C|nr:lysM domain receptor-like kinase 4 [Potentilla anserina]